MARSWSKISILALILSRMLIYTTKQKHQYCLQDFVTAILITRANKTIKPIVWYKTFFLAQESSNN